MFFAKFIFALACVLTQTDSQSLADGSWTLTSGSRPPLTDEDVGCSWLLSSCWSVLIQPMDWLYFYYWWASNSVWEWIENEYTWVEPHVSRLKYEVMMIILLSWDYSILPPNYNIRFFNYFFLVVHAIAVHALLKMKLQIWIIQWKPFRLITFSIYSNFI